MGLGKVNWGRFSGKQALLSSGFKCVFGHMGTWRGGSGGGWNYCFQEEQEVILCIWRERGKATRQGVGSDMLDRCRRERMGKPRARCRETLNAVPHWRKSAPWYRVILGARQLGRPKESFNHPAHTPNCHLVHLPPEAPAYHMGSSPGHYESFFLLPPIPKSVTLAILCDVMSWINTCYTDHSHQTQDCKRF